MQNKPTEQEIDRGYKECGECGGIQLLQAGFEIETSSCVKCGEHVADKDDFFGTTSGLIIL